MAYINNSADSRQVIFENSALQVAKLERLDGWSLGDWEEAEPVITRYIEISFYTTAKGTTEAIRFLYNMREELLDEGNQQLGVGFLQSGSHAFVEQPSLCTIFDRVDHVTSNDLWMASYYESFKPNQLAITLRFTPTLHSVDQALLAINWAIRKFIQ